MKKKLITLRCKKVLDIYTKMSIYVQLLYFGIS